MADSPQVYRENLRGGPYREDVLDMIFSIVPLDTPFVNTIGRTTRVRSIWHDWQKRTFTVRGHNVNTIGDVYGVATSFDNALLGTRESNWCQILRRLPYVSGTQQAIENIGYGDLMADQTQIAMRRLATDIEHAALRGSLATGDSDTAGQMQGAINAQTYNSTTSAVSFTENVFMEWQETGWSRGARFRDAYVHGRLKRNISQWTSSSTKYVFSEDKRLVNAVDVHESDFYVTRIHLSHDMIGGSGSTQLHGLLLIDRDMFKLGWLRPVGRRALNIVADGMAAEILGEGTLEYGHPAAGLYLEFVGSHLPV